MSESALENLERALEEVKVDESGERPRVDPDKSAEGARPRVAPPPLKPPPRR